MEINNPLKLIVYSIFTFSVIFIGVPASLYLIKKGIEGVLRFGCKKLPVNYLVSSGLGTYAWEVVLYGILILVFSIWYLFIDRGGHLFPFIKGIGRFFH